MGRPIACRPLPPIGRLKILLRFDAKSGKLYWLERDISTFQDVGKRSASHSHNHWNSNYADEEAGGIRPHGYHMVMIDGVHYMAHRVVWMLVYGEEPIEIDHIDGDRSNNRLGNLRSVDRGMNMKNKALYLNNTSGIVGVEFHKRDKVWIARIGVGDGEQIHLGNFKTREEAIACRIGAEVVAQFHINHGRTP